MYKNHVVAIIYLHVKRAFILNFDLPMRDTNVSYNDHLNVTAKLKNVDKLFRNKNRYILVFVNKIYMKNKYVNEDAYD